MVRHRRMLSPIQTVKHYVHRPNTFVATGAILVDLVAESVVAPATANAFSVSEGSVLKAIYIERWLNNSGATDSFLQFTLIVEKLPGNTPVMTTGQAQNLGAYPNKKNILYTTQGVLAAGVDGAQSIPATRNWILIPKGKQRMGLDDRIAVNVFAVGSLQVCGITIYKEYK